MSGLVVAPRDGGPRQFAVVVADRPDLGWLVDLATGTVTAHRRGGEFALVASAHDLVALIRGQENAGSLLRSGRLRYAGPRDEGYEAEHVNMAVSALRA
jgi:hypothetical protein